MRQLSVAAKPIFVDLPTAAAMLSLSESTIQALVRAGRDTFPPPRVLSGRRSAWLFRELVEWAESRPCSELPPPPNTSDPKRRGRTTRQQPAAQEDPKAA